MYWIFSVFNKSGFFRLLRGLQAGKCFMPYGIYVVIDGKIRVTKGNDSRLPKSVVCADTYLWEPNKSL
jgi:hypothetical protein